MSYTVNFERATADYDIARGKESLRVAEEGQAAKVIPFDAPDGYVGELRHFIECARAGKSPTVVTAAEGLASVEICEAEERSVNERQIVTL
jgi:predicted dehydrogenase